METATPVHAPLYPSSLAYTANDCRGIVALCPANEQALRSLLAATPFEFLESVVLVEAGVFGQCSLGDFRYAGVLVPVRFGDITGAYYAYSYVDTDASLALGREPYGYPKKLAIFEVHEGGDEFVVVVERAGEPLLKIRTTLGGVREQPGLRHSPFPHLLLHVVPDVDGDAALVRRVVSRDTSVEPTRVVETREATATLTVQGTTADPLDRLAIGAPEDVQFSRATFASAPGVVVGVFAGPGWEATHVHS